MGLTTIEWTTTIDGNGVVHRGYTFNPWIGCAKVSPGCKFCFAENDTFARTCRAHGVELWGVHGQRHRTSEVYWRQPLKWQREVAASGVRGRVFCASLADVFEDRHDLVAWRDDLFRLIAATPNLDWLLLTKRPENILKMWPELPFAPHTPADDRYANIWLGTSVENQATANERIPELLKCRHLAPVLFLSCEPLLGPVDLLKAIGEADRQDWDEVNAEDDANEDTGEPDEFIEECEQECDWINFGSDLVPSRAHAEWKHGRERRARRKKLARNIDWVIIGGETGPSARPFVVEAARSIIYDLAKSTALFVKQLGANPMSIGNRRCHNCTVGKTERTDHDRPSLDHPIKLELRDRKGDDMSEWPEDLRVRNWPRATS